jgi:hypothetical protein
MANKGAVSAGNTPAKSNNNSCKVSIEVAILKRKNAHEQLLN